MRLVRMTTTGTIKHEGAWHGPGCPLDMTVEEAEAAKAANLAVETPETPPKASPKATGDGGSASGPAAERDTLVLTAVTAVPAESYGGDGKPNVRDVSAAAGFKVTAAERDTAWAQHQAGGAAGHGELPST